MSCSDLCLVGAAPPGGLPIVFATIRIGSACGLATRGVGALAGAGREVTEPGFGSVFLFLASVFGLRL